MSDDRLRAAMRSYFAGERSEAIAIILLAVALLVTAATLVWLGDLFARGLAAMLVLTALVAGSAAGALLIRDAAHVRTLMAATVADPDAARAGEQTRIARVIANYPLYRISYGVGVVVAAGLALGFSGRPLWTGIATGLLLFAAIGLVIDHYSEARAQRYRAALPVAR